MQVTLLDPGNFTPYYVGNLCEALAARGLEVDLITSAPLFEPTGSARGVTVRHEFFKQLAESPRLRRRATLRRILKIVGYPFGLWRTWRVLKSRPPGVLHVQWALIPPLDAILLQRLRARGWRVVYTAHDVDTELDRPFRRSLHRRIYRDTDAVIVHSEALARTLRDDSGDVLREVRVIPEGIATFPLSPGLDQESARRFLGLDSAGPMLLFFGLIKPYKGLEYLLRAWALVAKEFPDARLVIAGEALQQMRPVCRLIDAMGIARSLVLRLGFIPREEAQYYFLASDAVVLPYTRIATSSVVPLAYRFARPVIATCVGGLPELVREGETGFLVPARLVEPLAQAISRAIRSRESLVSMGIEAHEWFARERGWGEVARQTEDLYRSLSPGTRDSPVASLLREGVGDGHESGVQ